jgi:hypothetical protein
MVKAGIALRPLRAIQTNIRSNGNGNYCRKRPALNAGLIARPLGAKFEET